MSHRISQKKGTSYKLIVQAVKAFGHAVQFSESALSRLVNFRGAPQDVNTRKAVTAWMQHNSVASDSSSPAAAGLVQSLSAVSVTVSTVHRSMSAMDQSADSDSLPQCSDSLSVPATAAIRPHVSASQFAASVGSPVSGPTASARMPFSGSPAASVRTVICDTSAAAFAELPAPESSSSVVFSESALSHVVNFRGAPQSVNTRMSVAARKHHNSLASDSSHRDAAGLVQPLSAVPPSVAVHQPMEDLDESADSDPFGPRSDSLSVLATAAIRPHVSVSSVAASDGLPVSASSLAVSAGLPFSDSPHAASIGLAVAGGIRVVSAELPASDSSSSVGLSVCSPASALALRQPVFTQDQVRCR